jgi:signal transduction histidine kinase
VRRRIARTIVGVAALVVVLLGVPFAIMTQRFYESRATVELQRAAAQAIAELALPLHVDEIADAAREPDAPKDFSVYDEHGSWLFGPGPDRLDISMPDEIVVVSPITERSTETVVGSVRVSRPRSVVAGQARRAWAIMALAAVAALALAMVVARREAARLAAPISELADRAARLGSGEFHTAPAPTGTPELDTLDAALAISAHRLEELVTRERAFSANASHQLRTPLAGLHISLARGDLAAASAEADRLSATVDHMLALARNALPAAETIEVGPVLDGAARRWQAAYHADGRDLVCHIDPNLPGVRVRPGSLDQTIDVLLDNAFRHGAGVTRLTARPAPGGLVVQVDDEGPGINVDRAESIFDRHASPRPGTIGLALARTLVEADGGRLVLADPDHAEFRLIFARAHPATEVLVGRAAASSDGQVSAGQLDDERGSTEPG